MKRCFYWLAATVVVLGACQGKPEAQQEANASEEGTAAPATVTESVSRNSFSSIKPSSALYPTLSEYLSRAEAAMGELPAERKKVIGEIAGYVSSQLNAEQPAQLTFICTHNSRRSHMGQLWAATAAAHYGINDVHTFSGGTEATAFNPRAVAALQRAGFTIENPSPEDTNPRYQVSYGEEASPMLCFSKKYDATGNPAENFAAVMTCAEADENCPFIPGATKRVPLTYEDPKVADGTPEEAARYDERSFQIATEMLYLFSQVKNALEG